MNAACAIVARRVIARMMAMEAFWLISVDDIVRREASSYRLPRAYIRAAVFALIGPDVSRRRPYRISRRKRKSLNCAASLEQGAHLMEHVALLNRKRVGGVVRLPAADVKAARAWQPFSSRIKRRLLTALRFVVFARAAQCAQSITSGERPPF